VDDAELVRQLRHGDGCAAQALYQRHVAGLLRFTVAIGGCRQTAEDAVHDTFIELLRHPQRFDPRRGSLSAYLFSIARHRMARFARSARRSVQLTLDDADELAKADRSAVPAPRLISAEDEAERAHSIEQVRAAILALPLLHREVIALCDLEELPYADVALILNCPLGTVRSRLHRARAQLALRLHAAEPGREQCKPPPPRDEDAGAAGLLTCRGSVT
jgi:RNA polymerase sigma-70 factor (ECF subfamily)